MSREFEALLTSLSRQRSSAIANGRCLVRVDLPPADWDTLRRELVPSTGAILDHDGRRIFGVPVRAWDGIKAPTVVSV